MLRGIAKRVEGGMIDSYPLTWISTATLSLLLFTTCDGQRDPQFLTKSNSFESYTANDANSLHAVVAVARGEADFIVEWLNYHTWLGYGRFYIYNQDDDPTVLERLLSYYTSAGIVLLKHWPHVGDQRGSYVDFIHRHAHDVTTFTFLDGDEFLSLCKHATIDEFLADEIGPTSSQAEQKKPSCLELPWYMFGTSDLPFHPPRTSVLTQYFHRAKCPVREHAGKVIVRAGKQYNDRPKADIDRHTGTMHHFCREHTTNSSSIKASVASIFHYSLRNGDLSFAMRTKRGTQGDFAGQKMYEGITVGAFPERNEHRDATMLRILDSVPNLLEARPLKERRKIDTMLKCPDLSQEELDC